MKNIQIGILFFCALAQSCINNNLNEENLHEKIILNGENRILGAESVIKGDAHSGNFFSRINNKTNYSLGYSDFLSDTLINQNIEVNLSAWVRVDSIGTNGALAISVYEGDKCLTWKEYELKLVINKINEWQHVFVTHQIPKKIISKKGLQLNVFGFKPNGNGNMDIDDLEISIYRDSKLYPE